MVPPPLRNSNRLWLWKSVAVIQPTDSPCSAMIRSKRIWNIIWIHWPNYAMSSRNGKLRCAKRAPANLRIPVLFSWRTKVACIGSIRWSRKRTKRNCCFAIKSISKWSKDDFHSPKTWHLNWHRLCRKSIWATMWRKRIVWPHQHRCKWSINFIRIDIVMRWAQTKWNNCKRCWWINGYCSKVVRRSIVCASIWRAAVNGHFLVRHCFKRNHDTRTRRSRGWPSRKIVWMFWSCPQWHH